MSCLIYNVDLSMNFIKGLGLNRKLLFFKLEISDLLATLIIGCHDMHGLIGSWRYVSLNPIPSPSTVIRHEAGLAGLVKNGPLMDLWTPTNPRKSLIFLIIILKCIIF